MPQYTAVVDGIAARMPQEGHLVAQHLYVYDGDVAAQDKVAKQFEALAGQDEKAFAAMLAVLSNAPDPQTRAAADGVKKLRDGYVGLLGLSRKAIEASRKETVGNVEERIDLAALYTDQLLKLQTQIGAAVAASSKGTITYAAGEGQKASDAISATKRSILIAAILSVLIALALAVVITRSVTRPVHQLQRRLESLNKQDLEALSGGLEACADGDLTQTVSTATTPGRGRRRGRARPPQPHLQRDAGQRRPLRRVLQRHARQARRDDRARLDLRRHGLGRVAADGPDLRRDDPRDRGDRLGGGEVAQGAETQVRVVESARRSAAEAARAASVSAQTAEETAKAADEARAFAVQGVDAANSASEAMRQVAEAS